MEGYFNYELRKLFLLPHSQAEGKGILSLPRSILFIQGGESIYLTVLMELYIQDGIESYLFVYYILALYIQAYSPGLVA